MEILTHEGEKKLITYLGELWTEGSKYREEQAKNWSRAVDIVKGKVWPERRPAYKVSATMNFLDQIVEKKVALLTDSRPTIRVDATKVNLDHACTMLTKTIEGILEERFFERKLTEFIFLDQYFGMAYFKTPWCGELNFGKGAADVEVIDPRSFIFDPFVRRAYNIPFGEYACFEDVRPLDYLLEKYNISGKDIDKVKADFGKGEVSSGSVVAKIKSLFFGKDKSERSSVIPRSIVRDWWIMDRRTKVKSKDKTDKDGNPLELRAFKSWRHVVVTGGHIAVDDNNPYIDGMLPYDGMDWSFDPDSAYGRNEVDKLEMPQLMLNKLLGTTLESSILMSNPIWIGDRDALSDPEWARLNNEPGTYVRKRPGRDLKREAGVSLPASLTQVLTMLATALKELGGDTEAGGGRKPGQVCVDTETECLTKRGWMKYNQLIDGDEIYSFDPLKEVGAWSPVLGVRVYNWDDPVYHIHTDLMDCVTTPNHGWMVGSVLHTKDKEVKYRNSRSAISGWRNNKYQRIEMQDLNTTHYQPSEIRLNTEEQVPAFSNAFVMLAGWIVTEGTFSITKRENEKLRYRVIISQSQSKNRENCVVITQCLNKLGIHYSIYIDPRADVMNFTIDGSLAQQLMEVFPEKRLKYGFITALTTEQLDLLYDTMLAGDGSRNEGDIYFSADKQLLEQFQMIAVLCGRGTRQSFSSPSKSDRHKRACYGDIYKVSARSERTIKWANLFKYRELKPYNGVVWCPQTLYGTWLARRNGVTYLTGNTSGQGIEALQLAATTTVRLKARQVEYITQNVGQKLVSRIFQYMDEDRVYKALGDTPDVKQFVYEQSKLKEELKAAKIPFLDAHQVFQFKVAPASSLSMTKWQRGLIATQLYQLGAIDREALLEAIEYPNREEILKRTKAAQASGEEPMGVKKGAKLPKQTLKGGHQEGGMQHPVR